MQDTNRNSDNRVESDAANHGEAEQQPAWAPPQASHNAYFDDQRTVYQRMTHEAKTSPEDDVDDVFSAPLEAADEHPTTQLDLPGMQTPKTPTDSISSGDDPTTQLTPGNWTVVAGQSAQPETFGPPGAALSDLHDEGLGATMHGNQAFASFPAQEDAQDSQETTMLAGTQQPPESEQVATGEPALPADGNSADSATNQTRNDEAGGQTPLADPEDAATTMLTPEYAQQYTELSDQAAQQAAPQASQQTGGDGQADYSQQLQPHHQTTDGQPDYFAPQSVPPQPYQDQPYGGQQGWGEQATYLQQPYAEQPFYPDPQQNYQADTGYLPYEAEQPGYPAGYTPQQTPFDPSHGAALRDAPTGYPPYAEPQPGYHTPEQQHYLPAEHQYTKHPYTAPEQHYPALEHQHAEPALGEPPVPEHPVEMASQQVPVLPVGATPIGEEAQHRPYMVPQNVPGRFVPTAEEFAARRAHKPQTPEATMGLPGLVKRLTFGIFAPPMSKKEEEHREYVTTVRRNFGGLRQITVVNPKGGAGKTVASLMTAMTFGQNRGGYVLAWDNNETQGTLGMRAQPDFHAHTVRDVLQSLDTFLAASGKVGDLSSFVRSQGEAMFDVLASDESATAGEMLTAAAFKQIREVVSRFYKLIIVDTGNNVRAENWQAAIDQTDQLMVTMSARGDSAETAARMLDHLEQTGRSSLVRHAVTVVSMPPSRRGLDLPAIERHFSARTRAVLIAPYEPIIDSGEPIHYENISNASKEAWLRIASGVAEGL